MQENSFSRIEIKFIISMGVVLSLRELSMTMLNPFISIYGKSLSSNTPFLCGLALGIYGLTNAIFQIPYGQLSDKHGRKPIILIGLMQLLIGLILAYSAKNIYSFIFARALQGSGAIMAIAYSWMGDNIADDKKNRAMGLAGIFVALGAVVAFGLGPVLYKLISVDNMFLGCALLIFSAWLLILLFIRDPKASAPGSGTPSELLQTSCILDNIQLSLSPDKALIKLSTLGFVNNFVLSTMFFIVPTYLEKAIGGGDMWMVFLPSILIGIFTMLIFNHMSDKGYFVVTTRLAMLLLLMGMLLLIPKSIPTITIGVILIITGFMCLTSEIPTAVNKGYDRSIRGYANGILQTFTFLGFFAGPCLSGLFTQYNLNILLFLLPIILIIISLYITFSKLE